MQGQPQILYRNDRKKSENNGNRSLGLRRASQTTKGRFPWEAPFGVMSVQNYIG